MGLRPTQVLEDYAYWWSARPVEENYVGIDVVGWQGTIERQLVQKIEDAEQSKNPNYANKLREYLKTWRANTLTGSVNIETVNVLLAAADQLAVDDWKQADYFSQLRDNLRKLKASAEQLPPTPEEAPGPRNKPRLVSQSSAGAPSTDFGPQREQPGNLEPEPGETEGEVAELERDNLEDEERAREEAPAPAQ